MINAVLSSFSLKQQQKLYATTVHGASGGITASPLHHVPFPRLGGTPGNCELWLVICRGTKDGAAGVGDAFIVEGEDTMITSSGFAVCGPGITGEKSWVGDRDTQSQKSVVRPNK